MCGIACRDLGFDLAYMADVPKAVRAINKAGGVSSFVDGFGPVGNTVE